MQSLAACGGTWAVAVSEMGAMRYSELWRGRPGLRCSQAPSGRCGGHESRNWGTCEGATMLLQGGMMGLDHREV